MPVPNKPTFTDTYDSVDDFLPVSGSVYVSGQSVEARSEHVGRWVNNATDVAFVDVVHEGRSSVRVQTAEGDVEVALRSERTIGDFWSSVLKPTIYLDITGLRHHTWAALLRGAIRTKRHVIVTYVEPRDYRPSLTPTENEIYDLSERIEGISPLPGFASLKDMGDNTCFVPLLGFEGTRVLYLLTNLEPPGDKTIPVVGLPGFRPEYPFAAYLGNRTPLLQTQAWKKVRYANANCPFDLFYVLQEIEENYPGHILKIAPVGTKPHAIGAILYAIANPNNVELVYDHPIRKAKRTSGTARLLAYHVSALVS